MSVCRLPDLYQPEIATDFGLSTVSTAPLFARAIRNIHRNESVSSLFDFDDNEPPVKPARTGKEPARGTT